MNRSLLIRIGAVAFAVAVALVLFVTPNRVQQGRAMPGDGPRTIRLNGIVRDFLSDHPDFDLGSGSGFGLHAGNVALTTDSDGRPVFTGKGAQILEPWRDADGHAIAPHMENVYDVLNGCVAIPGIAVQGWVSLKNKAMVDSWDSSIGPYGGSNRGSDAIISTNSTDPGDFEHKNQGELNGTALVGPDGDPGKVYQRGNATKPPDSVGNLDVIVPMPTLTRPTDLPPFSGDLRISSGVHVIDHDLHLNELILELNGRIEIDGDVAVLCEGRVDIGGQGIVVRPGARLRLFLEKGFQVHAAPINMATWDPAACLIYNLGSDLMYVEGNTAHLCARVIAPQARLQITQSSEFYGTFVGDSIDMDNLSQFHQDLRFSGEAGFVPDVAGSRSAAGTGGITSAKTFAQWFRDVPGVNLSRNHAITLEEQPDGAFLFETTGFHPVDGILHANEGDEHNLFFTYRIDARFTYEACAGQFLEVDGDDDIWVFVGGRLAIDRGGIMPSSGQRIDVDRLGLTPGRTYALQLHYAQRQSSWARLRIRTNIELSTPPVKPVVTDQYD